MRKQAKIVIQFILETMTTTKPFGIKSREGQLSWTLYGGIKQPP
jgi:hypothetical protein